jgi:hypothetical protein
MKDTIVSLELATLLKANGFKKKTPHVYFSGKLERDGQLVDWNKVGTEHISAPTLFSLIEYILKKDKVLIRAEPYKANDGTLGYNAEAIFVTKYNATYDCFYSTPLVMNIDGMTKALDAGIIKYLTIKYE